MKVIHLKIAIVFDLHLTFHEKLALKQFRLIMR